MTFFPGKRSSYGVMGSEHSVQRGARPLSAFSATADSVTQQQSSRRFSSPILKKKKARSEIKLLDENVSAALGPDACSIFFSASRRARSRSRLLAARTYSDRLRAFRYVEPPTTRPMTSERKAKKSPLVSKRVKTPFVQETMMKDDSEFTGSHEEAQDRAPPQMHGRHATRRQSSQLQCRTSSRIDHAFCPFSSTLRGPGSGARREVSFARPHSFRQRRLHACELRSHACATSRTKLRVEPWHRRLGILTRLTRVKVISVTRARRDQITKKVEFQWDQNSLRLYLGDDTTIPCVPFNGMQDRQGDMLLLPHGCAPPRHS
ncbi:hypothetical protein BJV74DRAFT_134808 [Russula compacta]|nr:hypothetical protein BJV74DRAFT_134808 [Russula compacta]